MKNLHQSLSFVAYLAKYVGVGFISGGVVHYTVDPVLYGTIGIIGAVMFLLGMGYSHRDHLGINRDSLVFVLMSLVLSFGIGITSGGVQHFGDVGHLGPVFVSLGVFLSALGYVFVESAERSWRLVGLAAVVSLVIFFATQPLVSMGVGSHVDHHGTGSTQTMNMGSMDHGAMVKTERDFLTGMVPHHEEAIKTAEALLKVSQNDTLKKFLNQVVQDQSSEVAQMKSWHQAWYGKAYVDDKKYSPMMRTIAPSTPVAQQESVWLTDMIPHHQGALQMAEAVLRIPGIRPETRTLAENILRTQAAEIQTMRAMLGSYQNTQDMHDSGATGDHH